MCRFNLLIIVLTNQLLVGTYAIPVIVGGNDHNLYYALWQLERDIPVGGFASQPAQRRVAATGDEILGYFTYGCAGCFIYGHLSVVKTFTPPNTINIVPYQVHLTTWYPYALRETPGNQICRVYEGGNCAPNGNPNWDCCHAMFAQWRGIVIGNLIASRAKVVAGLRAAGYTVTLTYTLGGFSQNPNQITLPTDEYFYLRNEQSAQCIYQDDSKSPTFGAGDCSAADNSYRWRLDSISSDSKYFRIKNEKTGNVILNRNGGYYSSPNSWDFTYIASYYYNYDDQQWSLDDVKFEYDEDVAMPNHFRLKNKKTGHCMYQNSDGRFGIYSCHTYTDQYWYAWYQ